MLFVNVQLVLVFCVIRPGMQSYDEEYYGGESGFGKFTGRGDYAQPRYQPYPESGCDIVPFRRPFGHRAPPQSEWGAPSPKMLPPQAKAPMVCVFYITFSLPNLLFTIDPCFILSVW